MFPTLRGILLLLLLAPLIAIGTWLPSIEWVALVVGLAILFIIGLDWYSAGPVSEFEVSRVHDTKLSLGAENPIRLVIRSLRRRTVVAFSVRDEPPDEFDVDRRILTGRASPRATWESVYHVQPQQRRNYRFGNA